MRYALLAAGLAAATFAAGPAWAQQSITVHPQPRAQGEEIVIPPLNNPNYLDPGPMPDRPGSDKSMDYMNQAGGNELGGVGVGIGNDVDADDLPDGDGAYDSDP
ncbi:hypothetical protein [Ancylobacter defluvii]|uniref:Uncharacterized protein n=1 Tax=Ancylobacter defluvii TaxID=1282440 RepID=A0A9W6JW87_9HYPH|nr:hypothetical protein [Ancylobacter defluvii]MBS7586032.1 hypothetical protein [Ancylobacter defluvii]GLK84412.1 hypothetical protein GCM10017653_24820 [Ancylobacter defluvii]